MKPGWTESRGRVAPNNPFYPPTGLYCIKCRLRQYSVNSLCGNCTNQGITYRAIPDKRVNIHR